VGLDTVAMEHAPDLLIGVDRDGAFFNDDLVARYGAGDLSDNGLDIGKVGSASIASDCSTAAPRSDENSMWSRWRASNWGRWSS
jgi:hypothetical protein